MDDSATPSGQENTTSTDTGNDLVIVHRTKKDALKMDRSLGDDS